MNSPVVNIADLELESWERGSLYAGADVRIGPKIGVKDLGISYSEVPPGKSGCPFHNHHVEDEMFIILEGEGVYRFGDQTYPIRAGSVLGAPAGGRETAHQIINTGTTTLRYYGISTMSLADVCEYPDSGKFGVFSRHTRNPYDPSTIRHIDRAGTGLDYWDGEPGSEGKNE
jgi:uncharacterized cupin superfamily protein